MEHEHGNGGDCKACAALAAGATPEEAFNISMTEIDNILQMAGVAICGLVGGGENGPSITHTIGFTDLGMPEVIAIGMNCSMASNFLNHYFHQIKEGIKQPGPALIEDYFNMPVQVIVADKEEAKVFGCQAMHYYEWRDGGSKTPTFVQWVFVDPNNFFPWEEGYGQTDFTSHLLSDGPFPAPRQKAAE